MFHAFLPISFGESFLPFYSVSSLLLEDKHLQHHPSSEPSSLTTKASAIGMNGQTILSPSLSLTLNQLCASQWWIIQEHQPNDRSEI
jgi:hypothetical protein